MIHLKNLYLDLDLYLFTSQLQLFLLLNQVTPGITEECPENPMTNECQHGLKNFPEIGMCIGVYETADKWWQAETACFNKDHAIMMNIPSALVERFIQEVVPASGKKHWIGLKGELLYFEWTESKYRYETYSNWKSSITPRPTHHKECVVRDAVDGRWEPVNCQQKFGYLCYKEINSFIKVELEMKKGIAPVNTVYPRQNAHFKCRATTLERGKVVLRLQYARGAMANITSKDIKSFRADFNEETSWSNQDCTKETVIDLSFYVNESLKTLPSFHCCLMLFSVAVKCSGKLSPKVQYPDPIRPTLIVGYHNPPPTIYHGRKLRATCATNGGVIVWALKTHFDTIIWKKDQTGQIVAHPSNHEIVKDVEIKLLENKLDLIFGFVINSSFSVEVKPMLNNSVLSCYSHTIQYPNQVKNVHDDLRAASEAFRYEIYYKPHKMIMNIGVHKGRNVVFRGRKFTASCAAQVGSNGLMTFSIRQNNHLSMWRVYANGTKTILNQEIRFLFRINIELVKNMSEPFIKFNITVNVKKNMKGTVISCHTRGIKDPINTNDFWNQERTSSRILVYEPTCPSPKVEGTRLLYRTVAREDYTLVYYSCNETKLIPSPKWPVMCHRNPENGSLIWNATPPICIQRPPIVYWHFLSTWLTVLFFIIVVILPFIVPYNCECGLGESHKERFKKSPKFQYEDQEGIYTVHPTEPVVTVVNAKPRSESIQSESSMEKYL